MSGARSCWLWLLGLASLSVAAETLPPPADKPVDFARDVQPLLARSCYSCHGPTKQKSNFRLDRRLAAFKGGDYGQAIIPHKSEESPLIRYVAGLEDGMLMANSVRRRPSEHCFFVGFSEVPTSREQWR